MLSTPHFKLDSSTPKAIFEQPGCLYRWEVNQEQYSGMIEELEQPSNAFTPSIFEKSMIPSPKKYFANFDPTKPDSSELDQREDPMETPDYSSKAKKLPGDQFSLEENSADPKAAHLDPTSVPRDHEGSFDSQELDRVLALHGRVHPDHKCRRDVVIKTILRAMRRAISQEFITSRNLPRKIYSNAKMLRQNLIEQAIKIGLVNPENELHTTKEYEDFVCYLTTTRATPKFMRFLDLGGIRSGNRGSSSVAMAYNKILASFTHQKLEKICKNQCFKEVFKYYLNKNEGRLFLEQSPDKRQAYQRSLERIQQLTQTE